MQLRHQLTIWCSPTLFAEMVEDARDHFPLESGGVIMGWRRDDAVQLVARVGPGPKARHYRFSFDPDHEWQVEEVASIYEASGRRVTYLGDYHSHPMGRPRPSRRDRRVARLIAQAHGARARHPLILIIAMGSAGIDARVFEWRTRRFRQAHLILREIT